MSASIESTEGQPIVAVYSWGVTYEDQSCQRDNLRKWKASAVRELAVVRAHNIVSYTWSGSASGQSQRPVKSPLIVRRFESFSDHHF